MSSQGRIDQFLAGGPFAVVGASENREKYGNKVLRCYAQNGRQVFPVNPNAEEVEGLAAYPDLTALPEPVHGVSVITPPKVTEQVIEQAIELKIPNVWLQPGAESPAAIERAESAGLNVIAGGPCLLVVMGYHE